MILTLDVYGTLVAASLVLLMGRKLVAGVRPLRAYSIPEPVAGGLLVALGMLALHAASGAELQFDSSLSAPLMLTFFACIGLNANLSSLRRGGAKLALFLGVVLGLLVMQNALGLLLVKALGVNPLFGLLGGSISLSGGHGTAAAWSNVFTQRYGLNHAAEVGLACATFGLILGGLIGGPLANHLVKRVALPDAAPAGTEPGLFERPDNVRLITAPAMIETLALIAVCLLGGQEIADLLRGSALELPAFVCTLFVGVLLRNGLGLLGLYQVFERAVSVLGNVALALFLSSALMGLRLWELAALALPLLVVLASQTALMLLYARFITFRVMGGNYDAAVMAAGHCGFGLGATPTAIANMQAVTDRHGPSHLAFVVVPVVGAFFIDLANASVIKLYLGLPFFSG
jgi:glutamate:Na+ symporter, ESS family